MSGRLASSLCKSVSQIAARCSHTIYLARSNKTRDATRELLTEPSQKSAELPSGPTAPAVDQDMDTAPRITEVEDSAMLLCPAPPKRMCYLPLSQRLLTLRKGLMGKPWIPSLEPIFEESRDEALSFLSSIRVA